MAPKSKKSAGAGRAKQDEVAAEDPLQAIVLADSFETKFSPFTLEKPRCLLPLANTPLIEYTLESLALSGVEEVFLYCGAHTDQVVDYLNQSKWTRPSSPFKLETIRSTSRSIGDAMRDLDKRATMTGDFIVLYGDVISNYPLETALAEHRSRRKVDKNAIMTMVLREAGNAHRTKERGSSPVFVVDPAKQRCVHYEQMSRKQSHRHVEIEPELLSSHQELEIRHDLIDCGIDICTPDMLALWSDNFDYEAPRKGFLHSVLKDYELNGKTIHTHIIKDHYAARVRNLYAYDAITRDVISRWAFPMCPDSNFGDGQTYRFRKGNVYTEDGVQLSKSSVVESGTVLGQGTSIGEGSIVSRSVVGRNCQIGKNCVIEDAYIWDKASIGDDSKICHAIIASDAKLGSGSTIQQGALVSYGVEVASGTTLGKRKRMIKLKANDDTSYIDTKSAANGSSGGVELESSDEGEQVPEEGLPGSFYALESLSLSADSISTLHSEDDDDSPAHHDRSAGDSFVSITSDDSRGGVQASDFLHDAAASVYESLQKGHESSNIQLELTAMRMAVNASEHQVRRAVVTALMKRVAEVVKSGITAKQAVADVLTPHKLLIERTMFDSDREEKVDQVDFLLLMQTDLLHRDDGDSILLWAIRQLYNDMDALEEEAIQQWWLDKRSGENEELVKVRGKTQQLVDALAQMDSEEDGDDSGEE